MRLRRRLLVVAAAVTALGASAVASADNIQIEGSGDVTVDPGSSVVIAWRIHETGSDGCSVEPGAPVVVTVSPSGPVSASSSTLTFTSCGSAQGVMFTVAGDAAPGDYAVTVAGDGVGGDANATIHVPPPAPPADMTPPVI